jgi:hypothetical protein
MLTSEKRTPKGGRAPGSDTSVHVRSARKPLRRRKGPTLLPSRNVVTVTRSRNAQPVKSTAQKVRSRNPRGPRILLLDIETAPIEAFVWGLFDQNVGLEQIKTEWSILSFAAKWLGERRTLQMDTSKQRDARDDRGLLAALWVLLDEADIVVAQNGDRFDIPKIRGRMIMAGFGPFSPIRTIDTLKIARRHFGFTSKKQAWLTKHLTPEVEKLTHREFPGISLWVECLKGNPRAWSVMRRYNIRDVVGLEKIYLKLRPWAEGHPNVAAYSDSDEVACPKCGSTNLKLNGSSLTQTGKYQRYRCLESNCGAFARSRYTQNTIAKRRSLLSN